MVEKSRPRRPGGCKLTACTTTIAQSPPQSRLVPSVCPHSYATNKRRPPGLTGLTLTALVWSGRAQLNHLANTCELIVHGSTHCTGVNNCRPVRREQSISERASGAERRQDQVGLFIWLLWHANDPSGGQKKTHLEAASQCRRDIWFLLSGARWFSEARSQSGAGWTAVGRLSHLESERGRERTAALHPHRRSTSALKLTHLHAFPPPPPPPPTKQPNCAGKRAHR